MSFLLGIILTLLVLFMFGRIRITKAPVIQRAINRRLSSGPYILAVGGGTGLSTLLKGIKKLSNNITAVVTVKEAQLLNDDTYVSLRGQITDRLTDDEYTFKDETGTMVVEIDNDKWCSRSFRLNENLELTGEIEKKSNSVKLDVDLIRRIK